MYDVSLQSFFFRISPVIKPSMPKVDFAVLTTVFSILKLLSSCFGTSCTKKVNSVIKCREIKNFP